MGFSKCSLTHQEISLVSWLYIFFKYLSISFVPAGELTSRKGLTFFIFIYKNVYLPPGFDTLIYVYLQQ
jgi:hypothetical protein